jgi:hypothetical protein
VGYSKYTEDILDRWVEDTREREVAFYRQWDLDHIPPPAPLPGDIYLERTGKRLEDEEVFPSAGTLQFLATVNPAAAPPELTICRRGQRSTLHPNAAGLYTITNANPETVEIDAASGAYHRIYVIHFVEIAQIERIPGLLDEIKRFTANPPGWTRKGFDDFRGRLRDLLRKNSVPENFVNGLVEYFLAVQCEANHDANFQERLEAAYVIMRKFAPFSDIAAIITEYFRYRVNVFGPLGGDASAGLPLNEIKAFFVQSYKTRSTKGGNSRPIELVVAEAEYWCIEAVRAMLRNEPEAALGLASVVRKVEAQLRDPLREERLRVIEARAHAALGELAKAQAAYQHLLNSTCSLFRNEAMKSLQK